MNIRLLILGLVGAVIIIGLVYLGLSNSQNTDVSNVITSVIAHNQTQGIDALTTTAKKQDVIVYTLTAENPTDRMVEGFKMTVSLDGVTELATLIDAQGANLDSVKNTLTWSALDIPANDLINNQFSVRVREDLPGSSNLVLTVDYNNQVKITVDPKIRILGTTQVADQPFIAPATGPLEVWSFLVAGLATLLFAFHRFRRTHA